MENQTPQQRIDTIYEMRIKLKKLKDDYENERQQLFDDFENYCISISPYKIGDKFSDRYGRKIIIDCIRGRSLVLDENFRVRVRSSWEREYEDCPYFYQGYRINSTTEKLSIYKRETLYPYDDINIKTNK